MIQYFTFGYGQKHPVTGAPLDDRYVAIEAKDKEAARTEMFRRFGSRWAFQYDDEPPGRPIECADALGNAS